MSARVDGVASRVQSAIQMRQVIVHCMSMYVSMKNKKTFLCVTYPLRCIIILK